MTIHRRSTAALARATVAWGVLFAVVHAYWAAGGSAGMNGEPADTPAAQAYIAVIALIGLAGSAVAYGLGDARRGAATRRTLALLARCGGGALVLGVAVGTTRWVTSGSLNGDGVSGVVTTLYFLLGGVLFLTLARRGREAAAPAAPQLGLSS